MKPRHPALLSGLLALLASHWPSVGSAAERVCPPTAIQADESFRARFPELVERIQSELLARADIDACARVSLRLESEAGVGVSVALPDGRIAARSAARAEDVVPTLQALLLVPAPAPTALVVQQPVRTVAPRARSAAVARSEAANRDSSWAPATAPGPLGFELSVISGLRLGQGQFGYGIGILSFLQVHRWLIGFQGRADGYRSVAGGDPETALELALLTGRRFDLGSTALDLTAGPAVVMSGVAFSRTESVEVTGMPTVLAPPPARSETSSGPVPRLLVGARLAFSPRSLFRTFVGLDGEFGPAHTPVDTAADVSSSSASHMPTYTVGLAVGATVGAP
jgi:hypothetical protein